MGKRSFKEELEVLRSIFLDNLRGHSNLSGPQVAQIMLAFDTANKKLSLVREGWINSENESTRVKNLYTAGMSEKAISETLSIDRGRIQRILMRMGIWERDRWGRKQREQREAYEDEVRRMLELGMNRRNIAEELCISLSYVSDLANRSREKMQTNVPSNAIYEDIEMRWRIMDLFLNMDLGQLKKTVQFMQTLSVSKEEEENEK